MKTRKWMMLLACLGMLAFTGCETVFDQQQMQEVVTANQDIVLQDGQPVPVSELEPGTYNPEDVIAAGEEFEITSVRYVPSATVNTATGILQTIPVPYSGLAGEVLAGLFAIAATWQTWRKRKTDKDLIAERRTRETLQAIATTLGISIDTLKDTLGTLPDKEQARKLEEALDKYIGEVSSKMQVGKETLELLLSVTTPTKKI